MGSLRRDEVGAPLLRYLFVFLLYHLLPLSLLDYGNRSGKIAYLWGFMQLACGRCVILTRQCQGKEHSLEEANRIRLNILVTLAL